MPGGKPSKDVAQACLNSLYFALAGALRHEQVHHYPPKEMAADVGSWTAVQSDGLADVFLVDRLSLE